MSDLIERIRLVLYPYRNFNHNIAVVDELIELINEESAKEQQEEPKCSEYTRESIQTECVLDGCKFHAKEPQECNSDLISRKALARELFYFSNGSAYPMRDCDNFPIIISLEELRKVIHNQPQVQPTCFGCTYDYKHGYLDAVG